jgi:uncharacterized protein
MTHTAFRHLHPPDFRVMPWKNGGGTTTELIIEPEGSTLDSGFLWRLSMAEVGVSGPFSRFEGYDRTLLLLEGRGMNLDFEGRNSVHLDTLLSPVAFSGDWNTAGALIDGPCRDFNVITRRSSCRHRLEIQRPGAQPTPMFEASVRFLFCLSGRVLVEPFDLELAPSELLRIDGASERLRLSAPEPGAAVISVGIDPQEPSEVIA